MWLKTGKHWSHHWKRTVNCGALINSLTEKDRKAKYQRSTGNDFTNRVDPLGPKASEVYFSQKDHQSVTLLTYNIEHGNGHQEGFFEHKATRVHSPSRRQVVCYPLPNCFVSKGKKNNLYDFCVHIKIKNTSNMLSFLEEP